MASTNSMLAPSLKTTEKIDFTSVLRNFITSAYDDPPGTHDKALEIISSLRNSASQAYHPGLIGDIIRYCQQAEKLAEKFPMKDGSKISINFSWDDAFRYGFRKHRTNDINYDVGSFVFNLGACYANQGANTPLNDEGCKLACQSFQKGAGAFTYVRDVCSVKFGHSPQQDLQNDVLSTLISLMLGQAQECFLRKALLGGMTPAVLAKLSSAASDFYTEAVLQSASNNCKGVFTKQWINMMNAKKAIMATCAVYYQGLASETAGDYGLSVAYLRIAESHHKTASKLAKTAEIDCLVSGEKISAAYKGAKTNNDKIYYAIVPSDTDVPSCPRHVMVKALPLSLAEGEDVLEKLVPVAIRNAHARYIDDVQKLIRSDTEKINDQLKNGSNILGEQAMPAALDALEQPMGIPESLLKKSTDARKKGGVSGIRDRLDNMRNLFDQNVMILNEAERILEAEATEDNKLRNQFLSEWSRPQSAQITKELYVESSTLRSKLDMARTADGTVRRRFDESYKVMDSLTRTDDLANLLPNARATSLPDRVKTLSTEIRQLLFKYNAAKENSNTLKNRLLEIKASDSIIAKLVEASRSASDEKEIMRKELAVFTPIQTEIDEHIKTQNAILEDIKKRAIEFHTYNVSNDITRKRQTVLDNLGMAGDTLDELYSNLDEGYRFYTDVLNRLLKFQTKCSDFASARKADAEELTRRIMTNRKAPPGRPPAPPRAAPPTTGYWQTGAPISFASNPGNPPPGPAYPPNYAPGQTPPASYGYYGTGYDPNRR